MSLTIGVGEAHEYDALCAPFLEEVAGFYEVFAVVYPGYEDGCRVDVAGFAEPFEGFEGLLRVFVVHVLFAFFWICGEDCEGYFGYSVLDVEVGVVGAVEALSARVP